MSTLSLPSIHNVASDLSDPDGLDGPDHPSGFMRMEWIASQNSVRSGLVPSLTIVIIIECNTILSIQSTQLGNIQASDSSLKSAIMDPIY
jgi:hypothetical protein